MDVSSAVNMVISSVSLTECLAFSSETQKAAAVLPSDVFEASVKIDKSFLYKSIFSLPWAATVSGFNFYYILLMQRYRLYALLPSPWR